MRRTLQSLSVGEAWRRKMQRWSRPGGKIALILPNQTGQFQTHWERIPTPPLQVLRASLSPRSVLRRSRPRARTPGSQPIRSGASPPERGGEGNSGGDGDGGDDHDGERIVQVPLGPIKPHQLSLAIYGWDCNCQTDLIESIKERGLLEPLHLARWGSEYVVLSRHRRRGAALALGAGISSGSNRQRGAGRRGSIPARDEPLPD